MDKVKLDVLRPWISKKITEYLHIEDDVVVEFVYNQLEDKVNILFSIVLLALRQQLYILLIKPEIVFYFNPRKNECAHSFHAQKRCKSI